MERASSPTRVRIQFDANTPGQTATFTLPSIPGQQYSITLTGQNNQSTSFFQFFIDADGPGTANGFVQLGNNFNFGSGFSTVTLPTFTDLGTTDFFRIVNGGTDNNAGGQIAGVSLVAVPGPIVGAGIPGLVIAFGGFLVWRRRRPQASVLPV